MSPRPSRGHGPGCTLPSVRTCGGAAAVLLVALLTGCSGAASAPRTVPAPSTTPSPAATTSPREAPARIVEGGRTLTRAGSSPFIGAVAGSASSRDLVVQITRLPSDPPFPVCTGVRWLPVLQETDDAVVVTAAAFAPRDSGRCVDGLDATVPLQVRLRAPIGDRRLVDGSDGREHAVFDAARMPVPAAAALPDGTEPEPLRWDEVAHVATRRWRSPQGTADDAARDVWIAIGPAAGIAAGAPLPSRTGVPVRIGEQAGRVWHGGGPYDVVVVRFPRGPDVVEVRTVRSSGEQGAVDAAVAIARSLT